jgi:hypothetical protein
MLKDTKIVISISVNREDLEYLRELGGKYGQKNNSGAFRILIEREKNFERQIRDLKQIAASSKETYKEVRNEKIEKTAIEKPEWDFLKKKREEYHNE